jgi:hypothetical protein
MIMEPFNIKIAVKNETTTLTILPAEEGVFKIVYYGGVLAAVQSTGGQGSWELISPDAITSGDLPFYSRKPGSDHHEIELDAATVNQIGAAIEQEQTAKAAK